MISDFIFIFVLILLNGFFAAAEIAMVSARGARLQAQADSGDRRAARALRLQREPGEFLATVQVGITLVATLASAVGGVEAARWLAPLIADIPGLSPYSSQIALTVVVLAISYASLLLGELVPKRLAIRNPERWAISVAGILEFLARIAAWPIRFLLASADLVMRLLGSDSGDEDATSPEEIEILVRRGTAQGIFLPVQERMITSIFNYAKRTTRDVMTPRTKIIALEADTPLPKALQIARDTGFSRFPVYRNNLDRILGYVHVKDLFWASPETKLNQITRQIVFIPESTTLPQASTLLTRARRYMGIVIDEFSGSNGLITLEDIMEVIVGEIEDEYSPVAVVPERGKQGEWCLAGELAIAEVGDLLGITFDPQGVYATLAGFIMAELGEIPQVGDRVDYQEHSFKVDAMERFRIKIVSVQRINAEVDHNRLGT
ncbi:MAG: HlyC/CorC family transporter [Chloroflexota bacterium]|nr:MAG: HlyC/CorC family transporter [Chloroflexota bacterium]